MLVADFDNPSGSILGLMTSILSVGAICATPFISPLGDKFGRRWGIWFGSAVMAVGGALQGASVHSESTFWSSMWLA
jgi:MFS family permease